MSSEANQLLLRIRDCRAKIVELENEIRAMPKTTQHELDMAKIKVMSLRTNRDHCKRMEELWHSKKQLMKQLGKGKRSLKHRKTHKKRWASRTTLRRS